MIQFSGEHGPVFLDGSSILAIEQTHAEGCTYQRLHLAGSTVLVRESAGDVLMLRREDAKQGRVLDIIHVNHLDNTYAKSDDGLWRLVPRRNLIREGHA